MANRRNRVQGEGDYGAARRYSRRLREHIEGSDVDADVRRALPRDQIGAREPELGERIGKHRAKEEDPQPWPRKKDGRAGAQPRRRRDV